MEEKIEGAEVAANDSMLGTAAAPTWAPHPREVRMSALHIVTSWNQVSQSLRAIEDVISAAERVRNFVEGE